MKNKTDLRLYAKELRKKLDIKLLSKKFTDKIRKEENYIKAEHVMLFYPTQYELDFRELLNDNKSFYLPKVSGKNLLVCPLTKQLKKSELNIYEPCSEPVDPKILDLVIVPALMADKNGYRLGYGGGFYDRFLPECNNAFKMSVVPKELYADSLPFDNYDIALDKIIYM